MERNNKVPFGADGELSPELLNLVSAGYLNMTQDQLNAGLKAGGWPPINYAQCVEAYNSGQNSPDTQITNPPDKLSPDDLRNLTAGLYLGEGAFSVMDMANPTEGQ